MLVNRYALIAATLSCVSVCWANYPDIGTMLNSVPADAIIAPNGVPLVEAVNALPPDMQVVALQSLSPLADGSLLVASRGSMRQFYEGIDERLRPVPKLCRDIKTGLNSGDPMTQVKTANKPAFINPSQTAITADPKATVKTAAQPATATDPKTVKTIDKPTTANQAPTVISADPQHSALNPTIHKVDPTVQKVIFDSWAGKPTGDAKTAAAKKEADLAKKEAELAKKESDLAKKETESKGDDKEKKEDHNHADGKTAVVASSSTTTSSSSDSNTEEDPYRCQGIWAQVLGSSEHQALRDEVLGSDAHVWGLNIGRDFEPYYDVRTGFAIGYQQARSYSDVYSGSFIDVKRYQLSQYGRYNYACCMYTQWALTGAFNRYDNKRKMLVLPSTVSTEIFDMAQGTFTGWEYDFYVEEGFTWTHQDFQINPKLFMMYTHLTPEGYFEKDAFNLDLSVKYQNMDILSVAGGFKFMYQAQFEKAFVVPEAHVYYFYNAINDKQLATSAFIVADYRFNTQGVNPEQSSAEIGGALAVHSNKYVMIKLAYDLFWNRDYHRRQGYIQARYEWA